ncbi:MAG TPA: hypothetical protein VLK58_01605 [Conexibacter sp.]|nr:hypothetical protein [Conexibacter sp.]
MGERDRRRAFAAAAACLLAAVAALLLIGGGGGSGGERRERGPRGAAAEATSPAPARPAGAVVSEPPASASAPAEDGPAAGGPPIMPAGQALTRADVRALGAGPPTAPAVVRAAARRFVEAYLVYELGNPPAALHDRMMALTGGRLRAALQHEPPRRPLATSPEPWRLTMLDGVCESPEDRAAARRCAITYVVRDGERFVPHAFTLEQEGGRWLATDLIG